ncbi:MAG: nucleotidyltransferase domain-containing protein [Symploca sp. SIO2D2]|nr:nucleotidyltransferase domain-containing protein [Symploca sp. SIO2D2]NER24375.1 nucleotidyltransferase domain-containing protein [Symploca sp. SIO1C2]NER47079.1 nucleotidyltransferase domain-containing protein [Symploca sp. SIO1A3]
MNVSIQTILNQTYQGLQTLYEEQLDQIILFGSQARGDAKPDSDIDILIVLKHAFVYSQESDRISPLIANLCLEYDVLISCAFATHEQVQSQNTAFFRNIRQEGVVL